MTPERIIQNQICSWLRSQRCFFFIHDSVGIFDPIKKIYRVNQNPYRIKGVSDIIGIWEEKFLAIEVKSKTGVMTDHQKNFITTVIDHGGIAFVARSLEDVKKCLSSKI